MQKALVPGHADEKRGDLCRLVEIAYEKKARGRGFILFTAVFTAVLERCMPLIRIAALVIVSHTAPDFLASLVRAIGL